VLNPFLALLAAIQLVSPIDNQTVVLLPDCQKSVITNATMAEREAVFAAHPEYQKIKCWRRAKPLTLVWKATEKEAAPFKIEIGKRPDLSDARIWYVHAGYKPSKDGSWTADGDSAEYVNYAVERANLEIATRYYWRVTKTAICYFNRKCEPKCRACMETVASGIGSFVTEDLAPRWIGLEGLVANVRDLGGRIGLDGRRIRQGLVYRGQGLNENSVDGEFQGKSRMTMEDVRYLKQDLGIRTDLDLRSLGETADLAVSPLGADVRLYLHRSSCYKGIFLREHMKVMAQNFRLFTERDNYPFYFHCIAGADRTGALAYVLNAVLGVSRQEIETDWESTFYPKIPHLNPELEDGLAWNSELHFNNGFGKYGDNNSSWNDRVILYLKDCGITDEEIETFREIMLEK